MAFLNELVLTVYCNITFGEFEMELGFFSSVSIVYTLDGQGSACRAITNLANHFIHIHDFLLSGHTPTGAPAEQHNVVQ